MNGQDVKTKDEEVNEPNVEMEDGKEVIDLCEESQTMTSDFWKDDKERK